jgi:release factor glutamine methyltransferase
MTAVDKSLDALEVAKENATLNDANVSFIESDLFANVKDKYDLIVSNPPYIKTSIIDTLQKEVKDNEPMMALDGGEDGLDFYKKIIKEAKNYLNKDGYIAFEIGFDQAKEVSDLLEQNEYKDIKVIKDFGSNDRVVIAKI